MKKVMIFGTFDIFHPGHRSFLCQAKKTGNYLIVVVARDKTVEMVKKEKPKNKEATRVKIIKNSQLGDKVVLGSLTDKYAAIKKYRPGTICLGYDQKYFIENLKSELQKAGLGKTEIIRLKPYKPRIYKSSKLKSKIVKNMIVQIIIENRQVKLLLKNKAKIIDTFIFPEERQLSEKLLPEIDKLIKKNKLKSENIEKMKVKSDLGENFTTYRIAKTVAETWNWVNCG